MGATLQIETNRSAQKYSRRVQAARVCWGFGRLIFRLIPRPMYGLRNVLLRLFGARVGRAVQISNTAVVYFPWELSIGDESAVGDYAYLYNLARLEIGERVTISHRAHLCGGTHDYRDPALPLVKARIEIGDDAWICADAFVGPQTSIGAGAVVGARAVVTKDVEPWAVVAGNPAQVIRTRQLNEQVSGE
jgi:putative colanic acid biosynthesis acetyltransferase WcaF